MSVDAWIVSFGLSTLLRDVHIVDSGAADAVMAVVVATDAWLVYRFFGRDEAGEVTSVG